MELDDGLNVGNKEERGSGCCPGLSVEQLGGQWHHYLRREHWGQGCRCWGTRMFSLQHIYSRVPLRQLEGGIIQVEVQNAETRSEPGTETCELTGGPGAKGMGGVESDEPE